MKSYYSTTLRGKKEAVLFISILFYIITTLYHNDRRALLSARLSDAVML